MENRIKEVIKERGYTMKDFADVLGITRENLFSIVKNPSSPTLEKLSNALNVPVWQFFATKEEIVGNEHSITCPYCGHEVPISMDVKVKEGKL